MSDLPFATTVSWDQYVNYRPDYPASMWKLVLDYHNGSLDVVHELGAGVGIGTDGLLRHTPVKEAYLSDPGKANLETAEQVLSQRHKDTKFVVREAVAEQQWLEDSTVDLVISCESFHWFDADVALPLIGKSLRPGGTLFIAFYHGHVDLAGNEKANVAIHRIYDRVLEGVEVNSVYIQGYQRGDLGLDFFSLAPDVWTEVRRLELNTVNRPGGEWPRSAGVEKRFGRAESQVEAGCVKEKRDDQDWTKEVTLQWFKLYITSALRGGTDETIWKSEDWREVEKAAEEGGGKLEISFPVMYVLARKC